MQRVRVAAEFLLYSLWLPAPAHAALSRFSLGQAEQMEAQLMQAMLRALLAERAHPISWIARSLS